MLDYWLLLIIEENVFANFCSPVLTNFGCIFVFVVFSDKLCVCEKESNIVSGALNVHDSSHAILSQPVALWGGSATSSI